MRYALSALVLPTLLSLPSALAQENEAEKLFQALEKKIKAANAIQITGDVDVSTEKDRKLKVSLLLTKDNQGRLTLRSTIVGKAPKTVELVSDGKQLMLVRTPMPDAERKNY